jgi:hypothetical protein
MCPVVLVYDGCFDVFSLDGGFQEGSNAYSHVTHAPHTTHTAFQSEMALISYPFRFCFFTLWGIVFIVPAIAMFVAVTLPQIDENTEVFQSSSFRAVFIEVPDGDPEKNKTKDELFHPGGDSDNIIAYFSVKSSVDVNYLLSEILLSTNITIDDLPIVLPPIPPEDDNNREFIKLLENIVEILSSPRPLSDSQRAALLQDLLNLNFEIDGHEHQSTTANGASPFSVLLCCLCSSLWVFAGCVMCVRLSQVPTFLFTVRRV